MFKGHLFRTNSACLIQFSSFHNPELNPSTDWESSPWYFKSGIEIGIRVQRQKIQQHHGSHETTAMQIKPRIFSFGTRQDVSPVCPWGRIFI